MTATIGHNSGPMFYGKPLTFNGRNHRYRWGDEFVPSVTTIINRLNKPMLIQWAADQAVESFRKEIGRLGGDLSKADVPTICAQARLAHTVTRDAAGDTGRVVHDVAKGMVRGQPMPALAPGFEQAAKALEALRDWLGKNKVEPVGVERRVFSKKQKYAGTCDFFGRINGRLSVLDFKTGNGVYNEAWFQTCGYEDALQEELGCDALQHHVIHLNKNTGEFRHHTRNPGEPVRTPMMVWRNLVRLDRCLREMPEMPR